MKHIAMRAERRATDLTKGQRKQLRASDRVLASVHGKDIEPISVVLNSAELGRVLSSSTGMNTLIDLDIEGERHVVRIDQIQHGLAGSAPLHIGLNEVRTGEAQKATVAVEMVGEPEAIRTRVGLSESGLTSVDVRALPERMVASLPLDISGMAMGDVLRVGDLPLPRGFELLTDPEQPLVSLRPIPALGGQENLTISEAGEQLADKAEG
ncbi:MAG: 50S ribosomal protein L25 [Capsulimonadales bacterium]|nr:50S ribosomal protein L25 [Capsulimonadales bacterium]